MDGAAAPHALAAHLGAVAALADAPAGAEADGDQVALRGLALVAAPYVMLPRLLRRPPRSTALVERPLTSFLHLPLLMPRPTLTRPELTEASLVDSLTAGVVSRPAHGHAGSAGVGTGGPAAGDASAGRRAHGLSWDSVAHPLSAALARHRYQVGVVALGTGGQALSRAQGHTGVRGVFTCTLSAAVQIEGLSVLISYVVDSTLRRFNHQTSPRWFRRAVVDTGEVPRLVTQGGTVAWLSYFASALPTAPAPVHDDWHSRWAVGHGATLAGVDAVAPYHTIRISMRVRLLVLLTLVAWRSQSRHHPWHHHHSHQHRHHTCCRRHHCTNTRTTLS